MSRKARIDIEKAIKRPGALSAKAKAAGMSTDAYARAHKDDNTLTGKQSRFYLNILKKGQKKRVAKVRG